MWTVHVCLLFNGTSSLDMTESLTCVRAAMENEQRRSVEMDCTTLILDVGEQHAGNRLVNIDVGVRCSTARH